MTYELKVSNEAKEAYEKVLRLLGDNHSYTDRTEVGILSRLKLNAKDLEAVVPAITGLEFVRLNEYRKGQAITGVFPGKHSTFFPSTILGLTSDGLFACYGGNFLGVAEYQEVKTALEYLIDKEQKEHPKRVAEYEAIAEEMYKKFGLLGRQAARRTMCTSFVLDYEASLTKLENLFTGGKENETSKL